MRSISNPVIAVALLAVSLAVYGCKTDPPSSEDEHAGHAHDGGGEAGHDDHDHPSEGPHHGSLIELGSDAYHAELVHDEQSGSVTIYLLDGSAKTAVPIEATELTINLKHDGHGEQFKLAASPDATDPQGKSSRFVSNDAELGEDLDREGADARLVVVIAGKSFTGEISGHDHGHEHD